MDRASWLAGLAVGVAAAAALTGCAADQPSVELPASWVAERSTATVELEPGGQGHVTDMAFWTGDGACGARHAALYSGDVAWRGIREGALTIEGPDGAEVLVLADGQFFSVDWGIVDVALCGEGSGADEVTVYARRQ